MNDFRPYEATGNKGLLSTITDSNSRTLTRSYDGLNRLSSVAETPGTVSYSYDAASNETGVTLQNGATVTKVYDHAGALTSITNAAVSGGTSTTLTSYSYSYDTNGEQTGRTLAGTAYTLAYDYDGQLTSITQGSSTTSFDMMLRADAWGEPWVALPQASSMPAMPCCWRSRDPRR